VTSTLVLGMGNPILSDDGLGLQVVRRLREAPLPDHVDVCESEVAGLRLLELVRGYDKVVIVDAVRSDRAPGDIVRCGPEDFTGSHRFASAHSIALDTTLELGRRIGYHMPFEVVVFAVAADDVETFGEELSAPVAAAAERVVAMVRAEVGKR
jgi:hydrogenase maturation protease